MRSTISCAVLRPLPGHPVNNGRTSVGGRREWRCAQFPVNCYWRAGCRWRRRRFCRICDQLDAYTSVRPSVRQSVPIQIDIPPYRPGAAQLTGVDREASPSYTPSAHPRCVHDDLNRQLTAQLARHHTLTFDRPAAGYFNGLRCFQSYSILLS